MVDQLTEDQIGEFHVAFGIFDIDGDKNMTAKELAGVMKPFGPAPPEGELKDMIDEVDHDGNGEIDFPEFLMLMGRYMKDGETEDELRSGFKSIDKDKDEIIGRSDIKTILNNLPGIGKLNDDEIQDVLDVCDMNGDGRFTYEDFVKLMMGRFF